MKIQYDFINHKIVLEFYLRIECMLVIKIVASPELHREAPSNKVFGEATKDEWAI
jgi:hypothetical protein